MNRPVIAALLLGAGLANATPIENSAFNIAWGIEVDGDSYTLDGNQSAVESLYLDDFWIAPDVQSLTFDVLFHWDEDVWDAASNVLSFRLFANGVWEDQWTAYSPNDLWTMQEPDFGDILASVAIDLSPYRNTVVDLGWSFIADAPELSYASVSNIALVPEPSTIALFLAAALALGLALRSRSRSRSPGFKPLTG